jgi:hypothetical protein
MSAVTKRGGGGLEVRLGVCTRDFLPWPKDARVVELGDSPAMPYVISARLFEAAREYGAEIGQSVTSVLGRLRDELSGGTDGTNQDAPGRIATGVVT